MNKRILLIIAVGLSACLLFTMVFRGGGETSGIDLDTAARTRVLRGDMIITVLQSGDLKAKRSVDITNETESNTKIIEIVSDGQRVAKGDLLVVLDLAELDNKMLNAESSVSNSKSNLQNAEDQIEIKAVKFETDMETAELKVKFANLDLKKYEEAEYPQKLLKAQMAIMLAEEEQKRAQKKLASTEKLVEMGFTSVSDLETADLEVKRKMVDMKSKNEELMILENYDHKKDLQQKQNDVKQSLAEVERLKKTYESEHKSALANLASKKTKLQVDENLLKRIHKQVEKSKIYADFDGIVFYPKQDRWGRGETIDVGSSVRPRQKILEFPDLSDWQINAGIPESIVEKVKLGQRAVVTVDAVENLVLEATVSMVGLAPNNQRWFDPSGKSYPVKLDVIAPPKGALKPGLSVMAEIIIDELEDVLHVPVQAVTAQGNQQYVYKIRGSKVQRLEVTTGKHNENYIEITEGLKEGDELLLYAPVQAEIDSSLGSRPLAKVKNGKAQGGEKSAERRKPGGNKASSQAGTRGQGEGRKREFKGKSVGSGGDWQSRKAGGKAGNTQTGKRSGGGGGDKKGAANSTNHGGNQSQSSGAGQHKSSTESQ